MIETIGSLLGAALAGGLAVALVGRLRLNRAAKKVQPK